MSRTGTVVAFILVAGGAVLIGDGSPAFARANATVQVPCRVGSLVAAIDDATDSDTLNLAPACRYVLSAELPDVTASITIDGDNATLQRSRAADTADFSDLTVKGIGNFLNVTINDLNFGNGDSFFGGGLDNFFGSVTINGGTFAGNTAVEGGAIHNDIGNASEDTMSVTGATFRGNSADDGGAIHNDGSMTITDCQFIGNAASDIGGGLDSTNIAVITGGRFAGNTATNGGGGVADASAPSPSVLLISGTTLTHNRAGAGGGIFSVTGIVELSGSKITDNIATSSGGGGFDDENSLGLNPASIDDSVFSDNHAAGSGGAVLLDSDEGLTADNSVLAGNTAGRYGGGLAIFNPGGTTPPQPIEATITGGMIEGDRAGIAGGGIYSAPVYGSDTLVSLSGTVVKANSRDNCSPLNLIAGCVN